MKKLIIILIALFLISGCVKETVKTECEPPRIIHQEECCLDADNSGVCDIIEEALKRTEQIEEKEEVEVTEEKIMDQCIDMTSWVTCEDIDISYDEILGRGSIKLQLKNNREGILVIKNFKFSEIPSCTKELTWSRDETGMLPAQSDKYVIECDALRNINVLDTKIEMDVNYYERIKGTDPWLEPKYMSEVEQTIKGKIKGST